MRLVLFLFLLMPGALVAARAGAASYQAAREALRQQRFDEALVLLDRAAAEGKQDAWLWTTRGQALFRLSRLSEAAASCDTALLHAGGWPPALVLRGRVRVLQHRLPEALADFTAALAGRPDDVFACGQAAAVLERLGRRAEGYVWRQRAATLAARDPAVLVSAGHAALALDRPDEAEAWLFRALAAGADAARVGPVWGEAGLRQAARLRLAGRIDEAALVLAGIVARFPLEAAAQTAASQLAALGRLRADTHGGRQ